MASGETQILNSNSKTGVQDPHVLRVIFLNMIDLIGDSRQSPHRKKDKSRQTVPYSEIDYLLGKLLTISWFSIQ